VVITAQNYDEEYYSVNKIQSTKFNEWNSMNEIQWMKFNEW
jgi:hypothetical protein